MAPVFRHYNHRTGNGGIGARYRDDGGRIRMECFVGDPSIASRCGARPSKEESGQKSR